jgi:hypothetical protein
MGFITNQWLDGARFRERKHVPVEVEIQVINADTGWDKDNNVVCYITVERKNEDYQSVYFTVADLARVLPSLVRCADQTTMKDLAIDYLRHLDGASLLEVLKSALSSHVSPGDHG